MKCRKTNLSPACDNAASIFQKPAHQQAATAQSSTKDSSVLIYVSIQTDALHSLHARLLYCSFVVVIDVLLCPLRQGVGKPAAKSSQ